MRAGSQTDLIQAIVSAASAIARDAGERGNDVSITWIPPQNPTDNPIGNFAVDERPKSF